MKGVCAIYIRHVYDYCYRNVAKNKFCHPQYIFADVRAWRHSALSFPNLLIESAISIHVSWVSFSDKKTVVVGFW